MQKYSHLHTSSLVVFVIRSYSDKTFFFATCDSDEHCSMDATVALSYVEQVTAVCIYIYTLLRTITGSWKILLGCWKVPEFILGKTVGTLHVAARHMQTSR